MSSESILEGLGIKYDNLGLWTSHIFGGEPPGDAEFFLMFPHNDPHALAVLNDETFICEALDSNQRIVMHRKVSPKRRGAIVENMLKDFLGLMSPKEALEEAMFILEDSGMPAKVLSETSCAFYANKKVFELKASSAGVSLETNFMGVFFEPRKRTYRTILMKAVEGMYECI